MNTKRTRVAIRDHRRLVREGLCLLLNDESDIDAFEFVDRGDGMDGTDGENGEDGDAEPIDVILTTEGDARDGVSRHASRVVVFHDASTIGEVLAGVYADARTPAAEASDTDRPIPPSPAPAGTLTPREAEILRCIAAGLSANEVSGQLGISRKTVEGHKRRIFNKLDVQNQAHAVAIATRSGQLEHR